MRLVETNYETHWGNEMMILTENTSVQPYTYITLDLNLTKLRTGGELVTFLQSVLKKLKDHIKFDEVKK